MRAPVAITGIGIVSPAGIGAGAFWDGLLSGRDLRGGWSRGDLARYPHRSVIEIPAAALARIGYDPEQGPPLVDRLAEHVVNEALSEARIDPASHRLGCFLSTTTADVQALEWRLRHGDNAERRGSLDGGHLLAVPRRQWRGPTGVLSTACSSGLLAPALAADVMAEDEADAMVAGGVDVLLEYTVCGFNALRLAADDRCRPFAKGRKGAVLAEGAAVFCLEKLAAARARGAEVKGVIVGYGASCDADNITAPNAAGIARAMAMALRSAGLAPEEIGGVFAHGTGTQANDKAELDALRLVFGERIAPPVTAIKSSMGHPQAAAGSFSLLAAILALGERKLPPTAGLGEIDPALGPVDIVAEARPFSSKYLMVNAFGFGGNNCVMVVAAPEAAAGR